MSLVRWLARKIGLTDVAGWSKAYDISSAGKVVSADTSMQISTVWSCVRLLAETIATLPLIVYERDKSGQDKVAIEHPLYPILHDNPSADYTSVEFWEGMVLSLCLDGNAYARKEKINERVVALTPLRARNMMVSRNERNERVYRYVDKNGTHSYTEDDILHIRGFGSADDLGLSPISFARHCLGSALAAEEVTGKLFANGVRPTGLLTIDQVLKPDQREAVQKNIVEPMAGSANAGGIFVLEAGMKFVPITLNPEDAQFLQTRQFQIEEICRWFRVPPFMVGHTVKSTSWGTGLEQQMIGFLTFSLRPYLSRIEKAIGRSLVPVVDRGRIFAQFKVEGLLRADSSARASFYAMMVQNGILTRNEVRQLENRAPKPGGDELTVQSQNVPLGQTPEQDSNASDDEEDTPKPRRGKLQVIK